jgi:hypothetical protein
MKLTEVSPRFAPRIQLSGAGRKRCIDERRRAAFDRP